MVIPIVWGRQRIPANMIWYGDFTPIAHTTTQSSGGKGGGVSQSSTTYTYTAAIAMGLCEGPIAGIGSIYKDKTELVDIEKPAIAITVNNEPHTIPSTPYQISVAAPSAFISDAGVTDVYGDPFTNVSPSTPTSFNQYKVSAGVYTFYSGNAGTAIQISYSYTQAAETITPLAQLGFTLFSGTSSQAPWGYLTSKHPTEAVGYQNSAYVASGSYDLGSSPAMSNHSFEILSNFSFSSGIPDANPKDVLVDFLTNASYGVGFESSRIADLTQFSNYCVATGLLYSPALTDQTQASSTVTDFLESVNCAPVYSEGKLKVIPYGDAVVTGNGVTFTPNVTPVYDLTDDDFLGIGEDPIRVTRSRPADAFNQVQVEFLNRANQYNIQIAEAKDQADVELNGLRPSSPISYHMICDSAVAQMVCQLKLQRLLNIRNNYAFKLGWRYCLLEPMDIVTITDPGLGLDRFPVRITAIEEDADGELTVSAEEFPFGVASAATYNFQDGYGYGVGQNVPPGSVNTPIVFEPPLVLTNNVNQIWAAVSGGIDWGGCTVWASLDGQSYKSIGVINGSARYGTLYSALPAPSADPDVTNSLVVSLNTDGQILAGAQADVDAFSTLCYVGGELVAYRDATLLAARRYGLGYLRRGLYGTGAVAHSTGAPFARLDQAVFKYDVLDTYVGKTIYLKFTSFNAYGKEQQNLAEVTAYSYSVAGGLTVISGDSSATMTTSEAIAAGDFVNIWDSSGPKIRKAVATDPLKSADGFCTVAAASGSPVTVYFKGLNDKVSGMTAGDVFLSATVAGKATSTIPTTSGQIVQYLGVAISATTINFTPDPSVTLA